jgi:signal transduction histidine kinase
MKKARTNDSEKNSNKGLPLKVVSIFSALIFSFTLFTQADNEINLEQISIGLGLSQSTAICQDQLGELWTANIRGKKFTLYKNIPGDSTSLGYNEVRGIREDKNGVIWVGVLSSILIVIKLRIRVFETQNRKLPEPVVERTEETNRQKEELKKANEPLTQETNMRKEAERQEKLRKEELIKAYKMISLGKMISDVAHELKHPISVIKLNSGIFGRAWCDIVTVLDEYNERNKGFSMAGLPYNDAKARFEELITGLIENSQRLEKIIHDLRDFSRPGDTLIMKPIDINKGIQSSVNLANGMLKKATTQFSLNLADDLPLIPGNFQKLEQVFINLIQNACQALPDKSRGIHISSDYKQDMNDIVVTVKDEGVGIDNKVLDSITKPFFTTKRDQGGTGLGISISLQIIREHNGSMHFESELGKGTTVTVRLPVNGKY